jgi:SAM-dependent methyltransferase
MGVKKALTRAYGLRRLVNSEETVLRKVLRGYGPGSRLLDVGCGVCRFYSIIAALNIEYVGTDINDETVERNRDLGRNVFSCNSSAYKGEYDVVLFSHVIEHLHPGALIQFLDGYLSLLKVGGRAVIFSPLMHRGFYDDFDHIKPYPPDAIRQLLCRRPYQVQPFSIRGRYTEVMLWFKRDPIWHSHRRSRWTHLFALPASLLCAASHGRIGKLTGYGLVLRKDGLCA